MQARLSAGTNRRRYDIPLNDFPKGIWLGLFDFFI
jgi:hypothetical protein